MWMEKIDESKRNYRFFFLSLNHESLASMYRNNFALMQHHKYSLSELEDMIPWEIEIYLNLLINYIKEEEKRRKDAMRS